jgi:hypothetical protein
MSIDTSYSPIPYIYESRGLIARDQIDQAPEYTYIQLMNCLEREERAMSSRYGSQIVNRDPVGSGHANYYFSSPVTSLSRLTYQSNAYRYAGLGNGSLQRRAGNTQGAYTQLTLPTTYTGQQIVLSGQPFDTLVDSCFETSQAFLFIADKNASIKDVGTGNPTLWGLDPSPVTLNVLPYAPLLILIDSFASGNSYNTSNITSWAWGNIETLDANSGQLITDFSQFYGIGPSGGGTTVYNPSTSSTGALANQTSVGTSTSISSPVISGFSSVVPSYGETVSIYVQYDVSINISGASASANSQIQYSPDGGTTWTGVTGFGQSFTSTLPPTIFSFPVTITNLNLVQVRMVSTASVYFAGSTAQVQGNILNVYATISNPGAFGPVTNGMLAILNTNSTVNIPISSIVSTGLVSGLYQELLVTTTAAHGLSGHPLIGIYASSSDLVDGFYQIVSVPSTTTFTVYFAPNGANGDASPPVALGGSAVQIGATGGYVTGGAAAPSTCVLTDQYSSPYPSQMSAWGFYEWVPPTTTAFPISAWGGTVAASTSASVGNSITLDLNQNNQVTDDDLIVITLLTSAPNNIAQMELQFFVGSGTNNYYSAFISPAYYQGAVAGSTLAYQATQSQILADTLGLITGQPPGTTSAQLQPSNISTGAGSWQACYIPRGNFLPVGQAGQAGLDWANVTSWNLIITTNANGGAGVSVNGLYLQWGYGPSSFAGVGYDYRQTYYNANTGTESNPTPIQTFNEDFGYLASTSAPIFLRQAAQVVGQYSPDPQVTHVRIYRRGGTLASNWVQVIQAPNITGTGTFVLKDVIADAFVEEAPILVLDNDPPVTSSLVNPIQTTLSIATGGPGGSIYSTFSPQTVTVAQSGAVFVPEQVVIVGNANNLEEVAVITGGTGQFTAILRLMHNQGEPVNVYAVPRQPCNLCALAYDQAWLAGDPNNPHYLYYSKKDQPENFGPENYIPVGSPDYPINAVINWRGTLIVGTLATWWIIVGGAQPYAQPTGSQHGIVAQQGWIEVEGAVWYRAADGLREFTGADGVYKTLPVEWIYRLNPECIPPEADPTQAAQDIMAYYNNVVYTSYISLSNSGERYRLNYDTIYQRFRQDDQPATAMLWEKDINTLLLGKQISTGNYAVVVDQVGDYDDGGWVVVGPGPIYGIEQTPINLTIQHPYRDLGKPHDKKNWNGLETDCNTQGQVLNTTLLFEDGSVSVPLAGINTGTTRQKAESIVNLGSGQEAYRASILHTIAVTVAPILYQESIDVALLPPEMASYDTYDLKMGTDQSKFIKQGWFDYTSPVPITVSLYADGSHPTPYWTFTLPAQPNRGVIRVRFSNINSGATAFTMRTWRLIMLVVSATNPLQTFQLWKNPRIEWKVAESGHAYQVKELEV